MKRKSKRVALTLSPEIDDVITGISKATNTPKTAIITELLRDTLPAFQQVLDAIEEAKRGQQELAVQMMTEFLGKASLSLNQAHLDLGEMRGELRGKNAKS